MSVVRLGLGPSELIFITKSSNPGQSATEEITLALPGYRRQSVSVRPQGDFIKAHDDSVARFGQMIF